MLNFFSESIRSNGKRTLSMLLVLLTVLGMFPSTAFAAEAAPNYAPTGNFDVNVAGSSGWNGTDLPLPVYDYEADGAEIATVPTAGEATPIAFAILEDNGGDRVKIGLAYDANNNLVSWQGGSVTKTGWVDKQYIAVNLPDILPSIVYSQLAAEQYSSRLSRYEYIVPCLYPTAEQIAAAQKDAMSNGETLMVCGAKENMADVVLVKGDAGELHSYTLDGATYQRYESWDDYGLPSVLEPFSVAVSGHTVDRVYSTIPSSAVSSRNSVKRAPSKKVSVFSSPAGGVAISIRPRRHTGRPGCGRW